MASRDGGTSIRLSGNQQLLLDDPDSLWVVARGRVQVFAVPMEGPSVAGRRRPIASFEEGEALFGVAREVQGHALLAVALAETDLQVATISGPDNPFVGRTPDVSRWVALWVTRVADGLAEHTLQPPVLPGDPPIGPIESLRLFHDWLRRSLREMDRAEQEQQSLQLSERMDRRGRLTAQALGALARLADPSGRDEGAVESPPLLAAMRAACRGFGIDASEPPRAPVAPGAGEYLRAVAAATRIRIRSVVLGEGWWKKDGGPLVAFRRPSDEPVALLADGGGRYVVFDPLSSIRDPVTGESARQLSPRAHALYRPFPQRALETWDLIRFGLHGQARTLRAVAAAGLLASVLGMATPLATGALIDTVIPDADRSLLLQLAGALGVVALGRAVFDLAQGMALVRLETSSSHATQAALWDRLLNMRASFFRRYSSGDLMSRSLAVSVIHRRLSGAALRTVFASAASLLNLVVMLAYNVRLALAAVAVAAATALISVILAVATIKELKPLQAVEGSLFGLAVQLIQGVAKLRVTATENAAFSFWAASYVEQQKRKLTVQKIQDRLRAFNDVVPICTAALLFWLSYDLLSDEPGAGLTAGTFLAFYAAFGSFMGGTSSLSNTVMESLEDLTLFDRARPILEEAPEVDSTRSDPGELTGRVAVDHVTFRYRPDGPLTLEDVSIQAAPGEFVAIVGPSGSGKSTLLRLLLGFEVPESGTVYYDGQDLTGLDVAALRRQLGVVLQSTSIIAGSVFDNLSAGAVLTLDDAWAAARAAGLEEDLAALPMGMHTHVSEGGSNLSGGQRQRLLIARALAARPKILFFDEATSALDNRTQAIVSQSLDRLHVTRLVIAHRLSTIQHADRIYVIRAGRVVQEGDFRTLAAQEGLFARMMRRQML